ncbi:MAG: ABC transporter permease subunit [Xanthomonadaceae bacterium]|nr:ABC transporter permease subunit [Xanthomonadaceae bacterium]
MQSPQVSKIQTSLIYILLLGAVFGIIQILYHGGVHLTELTAENVTIKELPSELALSFFRMVISYLASLIFAYFFGLTAARSKWGERIILPMLDIFQSMPVVTFFPAAIAMFIGITQGHRLGVEMAATFLIFTSQAWNMAFAVYESVKAIPSEQQEVIDSFGVTGSLRFWRLFAPASVPRLVYNSILSWSNGWFFLVACEIIAVGRVKYQLPGIGNFLSRAAEQDDIRLILWGLAALISLVLLMDYMIWRPASQWALRFKHDSNSSEQLHENTHLNLPIPGFFLASITPIQLYANKLIRAFFSPVVWIFEEIILPLIWDLPHYLWINGPKAVTRSTKIISYGALTFLFVHFVILLVQLSIQLLTPPYPSILKDIPGAILVSTLRVVIALVISLLWIVPVTLMVWDKPKIRGYLLTIAQIGASLPATALFPLIILIGVRKFGGGMEVSSIILLITGMQWYILFNSLGGSMAIPADIADATRSMGLTKLQTWKRLVLPASRPALITGAITAWGGGWNALVVSEYINFKSELLEVYGIGALINNAVYKSGDTRTITYCIFSLILWIVLINTLLWKPLYHGSLERYKFDG